MTLDPEKLAKKIVGDTAYKASVNANQAGTIGAKDAQSLWDSLTEPTNEVLQGHDGIELGDWYLRRKSEIISALTSLPATRMPSDEQSEPEYLTEVYEDTENGEIHFINSGNQGKHILHGANKAWKYLGKLSLAIKSLASLPATRMPERESNNIHEKGGVK